MERMLGEIEFGGVRLVNISTTISVIQYGHSRPPFDVLRDSATEHLATILGSLELRD